MYCNLYSLGQVRSRVGSLELHPVAFDTSLSFHSGKGIPGRYYAFTAESWPRTVLQIDSHLRPSIPGKRGDAVNWFPIKFSSTEVN